MLSGLAEWSTRRPTFAIIAVVGALIALSTGFAFTVESDIESLFTPSDLEEADTLAFVNDRFSAGKTVFLIVKDPEPLSAAALRSADVLARAFADEPGVRGIVGFTTLVTEQVGTLADASDDAIAEAVARVRAGRPDAIAQFSASDALLFRVTFEETISDTDVVAGSNGVIARAWSGAPGDAFATSGAFIAEGVNATGGGDVRFLMPLALLSILGALAFLFRRVADVAIPFLTVVCAVGFSYAVLPWLRVPMSPLMFSIAPVILGIGVDYALHFVYGLRGSPASLPMAERVAQSVAETARPIAFTAITTLVGFLSFLLSPVPQIRYWGILIALGALFAWLLTFSLLPALYVRFTRSGSEDAHRTARARFAFVQVALRGIVQHRRATAFALVVATLAFGAAAVFVEVDGDPGIPIDPDSDLRRHMDFLEDRFGGSTVAFVLTRGDASTLMDGIDGISKALAEVRDVAFVDSVTTRARAANGGALTAEGFASAIARSGDIVKGDASLVQFTYLTLSQDSVVRDANGVVTESGLDAALAGRGVVQVAARAGLVANIILSTGAALLLVGVGLAILLRSVQWALIAFTPLLIVVLWQVGAQSVLDIPINPITGIAAAMVIGIGVDYSIHVVERARRGIAAGLSGRAAAVRALESVGPPVLFGTATTVIAFTILSFSRLEPLTQFGRVAAIVIASALIVSLCFVGVVVARFRGGDGQ